MSFPRSSWAIGQSRAPQSGKRWSWATSKVPAGCWEGRFRCSDGWCAETSSAGRSASPPPTSTSTTSCIPPPGVYAVPRPPRGEATSPGKEHTDGRGQHRLPADHQSIQRTASANEASGGRGRTSSSSTGTCTASALEVLEFFRRIRRRGTALSQSVEALVSPASRVDVKRGPGDSWPETAFGAPGRHRRPPDRCRPHVELSGSGRRNPAPGLGCLRFAGESLQRPARPPCPVDGEGQWGNNPRPCHGWVAQLVEHLTENQGVAGSSPASAHHPSSVEIRGAQLMTSFEPRVITKSDPTKVDGRVGRWSRHGLFTLAKSCARRAPARAASTRSPDSACLDPGHRPRGHAQARCLPGRQLRHQPSCSRTGTRRGSSPSRCFATTTLRDEAPRRDSRVNARLVIPWVSEIQITTARSGVAGRPEREQGCEQGGSPLLGRRQQGAGRASTKAAAPEAQATFDAGGRRGAPRQPLPRARTQS